MGTRASSGGPRAEGVRVAYAHGVVYGFGTDTNYLQIDSLYHELKVPNLMYSPRDIVKLMGPNTAAIIEMSDDLGAIAPGKIADLRSSTVTR